MELGRTSRLRCGCADDTLVIVTNSATPHGQHAANRRDPRRLQLPVPRAAHPTRSCWTPQRRTAPTRRVTNALTALPDDADILLAAVDDGAALGAAAAIPGARADHVTMAAIGADQRARCEIVANPRWIGDAALFPDRYGEVAVPALLDALQGQEIPRNMYIETTFVTADSLGDYYDISDCPGR